MQNPEFTMHNAQCTMQNAEFIMHSAESNNQLCIMNYAL